MSRLNPIIKTTIDIVLKSEIKKQKLRTYDQGGLALLKLAPVIMEIFERYFSQIFEQVLEYLGTIPELNTVQKVDYYEIENVEDFILEISGVLVQGLEIGASKISKPLSQFGISLNLDNEYAQTRAKDNAGRLISQVDDTTRKEIGDLISKALTEGLSKNDLIKELQGTYGFSRYRASLIAANELGNAYCFGKAQQRSEYQAKTGLEGFKHRVSHRDDVTTEGCRANDLEGWIPANSAHLSGHQHPLRFPGCRCDEEYLPFIPDEEGLKEFMNPDEIPTYEYGIINPDKVPTNYDYHSNKVATPEFINNLGTKIKYVKPKSSGSFNPKDNTLNIGSTGSVIQDKMTEIHELGHAMLSTALDKDPQTISKLSSILTSGKKEVMNEMINLRKYFLGTKYSDLEDLIFSMEFDPYKVLAIKTKVGQQTKVSAIFSDRFIYDYDSFRDIVSALSDEMLPGIHAAGYFKGNEYHKMQEIFAYITEVYYYDNKLLEKLLPKTYYRMKSFYSDLGFNFLIE